MRVTNLGSMNRQLNNMNSIKSRIDDLGNDISTTKKVRKPSDDPAAATRVINFEKQLSSNETYIENIRKTTGFMDLTNNTLDEMHIKMTEALTELKFASNPENESTRPAFASTIDGIFHNLLDMANTKYDGKYLFGGTDHTNQPFVYDEVNGQVDLGVADISGKHRVKVSNNINQVVNVPGSDLFGNIDGTDVLNTLIEIKNELNNNNVPSDTLVERLESFSANILDEASRSGSVINQLHATETMINNQSMTLENLVSEESDTDIARSVLEMQSHEYALQLAYRVSSMTMSKSLMDYL